MVDLRTLNCFFIINKRVYALLFYLFSLILNVENWFEEFNMHLAVYSVSRLNAFFALNPITMSFP